MMKIDLILKVEGLNWHKFIVDGPNWTLPYSWRSKFVIKLKKEEDIYLKYIAQWTFSPL